MAAPIKFSYEVQGLRELTRAAKKSGKDADTFERAWKVGAQIIARSAEIPFRTGAMRSTLAIKAWVGGADISIGGRQYPPGNHASFNHYGIPAYGRPANPFLLIAREKHETDVANEAEKQLERILRSNDLL